MGGICAPNSAGFLAPTRLEAAQSGATSEQNRTRTIAKYVFSYRVPSDFVPGSPESVAAWQSWLGGMGSSLADLGEAVIEAAAVGEVASGTTRLAGYSVVVADDMDAALAIAKGCPALRTGGGVEVGAVMEADGS